MCSWAVAGPAAIVPTMAIAAARPRAFRAMVFILFLPPYASIQPLPHPSRPPCGGGLGREKAGWRGSLESRRSAAVHRDRRIVNIARRRPAQEPTADQSTIADRASHA